MNKLQKCFAIALSAVCILPICACMQSSETGSSSGGNENNNPVVQMTLSNDMVITCELYPEIAPITVQNFLSLVDKNYYTGTIFHRIIKDFMIQGGGYYIENQYITPKEGATTIKGEFSANGVENNLKHTAGVLSMARSNDMNSASGQFFICSADAAWLDGQYAAFGKVVDETSLQNVIEISCMPTGILSLSFQNFPYDPISIVSVKRV